MCGIAGTLLLRDSAPLVERRQLECVRDHMQARGPDGAGTWISQDGRVGLAHRRLAIIDLSDRGAQPMHAGPLSITFNGEIYNYRALRAELERDGEQFVSDSDTEVLLKLYARVGTAMFERLRGMYAFAIWDAQKQELLLGRDPLGIKPLYYGTSEGRFWFASQSRALVDTGVLNATPDSVAWTQFLLWGSVPEPRSCYAAVKMLPAGTWKRVSGANGMATPVTHFSLTRAYQAEAPRADDESVRMATLDSVRHHLIADVPVGVFLSAGIDSAAILGLAADCGAVPESVTLGFDEFSGQPRDEAPLASDIAAHYRSRHHVRRVGRAEFEQDLPAILAAMDQPSIDGINTWFVAKAAKELGWKVALSGLGGDELFGGYPSFQDVPKWTRWLGWARHLPSLGSFVGGLIRRIASHPKAPGMLRYGGTWAGAYFLRRGLFMPWEIDAERPSWLPKEDDAIVESLQTLDRLLSPDPRSDHARVSVLETGGYMRNQLLRDSDWASMAHSLELRVPLVDVELIRRLGPHMPAATAIPAKASLARAPRRALPQKLIDRPKTGFETPVAQWTSAAKLTKSKEPWARAWARHILKQQPQPLETARRGRIDVVHMQRRAVIGNFSVERLFEDVRNTLSYSDQIKLRLRLNRHPSRDIVQRIADAWEARSKQGHVNHITGDVHYLAWWLDGQRTVITVLDCVSLHRLTGLRRALFKYFWYQLPLKRAKYITVISEFTRRELLELTDCDPQRVVVIYPHLSDEFQYSEKTFPQRPRVLQIGTKRNKNLERVAQALAGLDVDLVIIGDLTATQRDLLDALKLRTTVKENLSREELAAEYLASDIMVFASTYEGFGLPIIEAQAVGRPVITSNCCSMPEVAADGACIVNPEDVASIRSAFLRIINDVDYRRQLVQAGLRNVERFRLSRIAGDYQDLYVRIAEGGRAGNDADS